MPAQREIRKRTDYLPPNPKHLLAAAKLAAIQLAGGGRWIRTTEAFASDLQSDPFDRSGTPPKGDVLSRSGRNLSTF